MIKVNTTSILKIFLLLVVSMSVLFPMTDALEPIWTYPSGGATLGNVAISSDGSMIVVPAGKIWVFSNDGTLVTKEPFGNDVAMTSNGEYLASSFGSTVYFFKKMYADNQIKPVKMWEYSLPDSIRSVDISSDGNLILAAMNGMAVHTIDTTTQEISSNDEEYNTLIAFSGDGDSIVGISPDRIQIYDTAMSPLDTYDITTSSVPLGLVLPQSGTAIVFGDGQRVRCVTNGSEIWSSPVYGPVTIIASVPNGSLIIVGTGAGDLDGFNLNGNRLWNYPSNPQKKQGSGITGLAVSGDGDMIAASTFDGKIILLDSRGNVLGSFLAKDHIRHIAISQDGSITVATGDDTIYAFSSGILKPPVTETQVTLSLNTTILPEMIKTQNSIVPDQTLQSAEIPPEYSRIITPTQSAPGEYSSILALLLMAIICHKRG